jgi:riboflavin kinase
LTKKFFLVKVCLLTLLILFALVFISWGRLKLTYSWKTSLQIIQLSKNGSSRLNIQSLISKLLETHALNEKQEWQQLYMLIKLAEMGAYRRVAKISTDYLAKKLGISQQTASRYLIELEHKNRIQRKITPDGSLIKIEEQGIRELQKLYSGLKILMEKSYPPSVTLEGTVFTGLGEGAYYIGKEHYRKQIVEKLGFEPYPGTLNLKLSSDYDIKTRMELDAYPSVEIKGFQNEDRTFGLVKCYPVMIGNEVKGALVTALRSHYDASVLEIIAGVCLRKALGLKDGNKLKIEVHTQSN